MRPRTSRLPSESSAIAITARGIDDYRQMFGLGSDALAEYEFLDCASGA